MSLKKILNKAVEILISGSGVAFTTSVVGLFFSLVFNWYSDHKISEIQGSVDKFNSDLEKEFKVYNRRISTYFAFKGNISAR